MKAATALLLLGLALHAGGAGLALRAADAPAPSGPPVVLPPMLVEESKSSAPWYYARVDGTEFLSRCSRSTTIQFIEAWRNKMQLMRVLVPDEFIARMNAPAICVLYSQDLSQTMTAEIQRELEKAAEGARPPADGGRVNIAPNMRLDDRDVQATIVYLDEVGFEGAELNISTNHVRVLLKARVPDLPAWLIDGFLATWRRADFVQAPITLDPLIWNNGTESEAMAGEPTYPRALLPAGELFDPESRRAAENQHPRHVQTRADEQELFVRWALASGKEAREALWKFAARAAEAPVTEEMFEACFGFDFSELRDRLSDYLPVAVETTKRIRPGPLPRLPRYEVERATPAQIACVRGEWERLAIWHVQNHLPQAREPYIAQARRTLHRAYDAGDRDPRLLAIMGLCEINSGNPGGAREFLEPATLAGVVRPGAYYELARLRFAELRASVPETQRLPLADLAPVIRPLQTALTQPPPLPEVWILLAQAWARCEDSPNPAEFAELELGTRLFGRRPTVAHPIAVALAQHGRKAEAAAVLDACAGYPADENVLSQIARLRTELAAPAGLSPTGR